jgi:hypothetical protein
MKILQKRIRHLGQALIAAGVLLTAMPAYSEAKVSRIPTQYIAALGDSQASSGSDAATWGLWAVDPGPRGVDISDFQDLVANAGIAPDGWQFNRSGWWLEEHGLLMEAPTFPLPAGQYVVTGGREVTSILKVGEPDATGKQSWDLMDGATIYDVTHLGCRAALYSEKDAGTSCSPDLAPMSVFPMSAGREMPSVEGCSKRDYRVLIVIGMMVGS